MMNEQTIQKLKEMHLHKMAETLVKIETDERFANLSRDDALSMIVDAESLNRQNNKLSKLLKGAAFDIPDACVENIKYSLDRKVDKGLIDVLSTCVYINKALNVVILGATGVGKTYLSCALGNAAVRNYYTVKYIRLTELFIKLDEAKARGEYSSAIKSFQKVQLLIIDEWLTFPISLDNTKDLMEILNYRYLKKSTIFCSQFEIEGWYGKINDPTYADAIIDRIIHNAYVIKPEGESMRKILGTFD